tara:strand:+ start:532 stop:894 length:363 start_codon:yes stop_codon:yes gene_type:complete
MSWNKINKRSGANKNYSLSKKLRRDNKSTDEFEVMLNQLSLEEVIGLKLELASRAAGNKLYGLPLWKSLTCISKDATLKYAFSACRTKGEVATFLGISKSDLRKSDRKYDTSSYFEESTE